MKILITGSSGFIGTELSNHLSKTNEIIPFDISTGQDILNLDQLTKVMKGCDVVIHLAAIRGPDEKKTFDDYFKINCEGTLLVAKAALASGVKKFIYTSSTTYYGAEKGIPVPVPVSEMSKVMTQNVSVNDLHCRDCDIAYSTSKVIAEQILANFGLLKKMQIIILRIGPTRKRGEVRPFGELGLNLKLENALHAIDLVLTSKKELWYEAFTILDENKNVDLTKAKKVLGYTPQ